MTEDQAKQNIAEIAPGEDTTRVKSEIYLRDQMDFDSMDFLDIVMERRKQHSFEEDDPKSASLDSCAGYLKPKFNAW
jgi:acyl carrier protein